MDENAARYSPIDTSLDGALKKNTSTTAVIMILGILMCAVVGFYYVRASGFMKRTEPSLVRDLYMGSYRDQDVLFLTQPFARKETDSAGEAGSDTGILESADGSGQNPFAFSDVLEPIKIASFDSSQGVIGIENFVTNDDKSLIYVIMNIGEEGSDTPGRQEVFRIAKAGNESQSIWTHIVGDGKYPKLGGVQIVSITSGKYVIMRILKCSACDQPEPYGIVILNLESGKEKYYGEIGEFNVDPERNKLAFKNLEPTEEACEPSPGCVDGKRTVYTPSELLFTAPLP